MEASEDSVLSVLRRLETLCGSSMRNLSLPCRQDSLAKKMKNIFFLLGFTIAVMFCTASVEAQSERQNPAPTSSSELSHQNMKRVAASATDVKSVLLSNHGQIVSDSDLTDDAILDRVESDIPFRSVATALVQRYGYLVPKINPDSDMGKEQMLLVQARAK